MAATKSPNCPICRKPVEPVARNEWFPFCSNRCKVLDLSKWLNNEYAVPARDEDEGDAGSVAEDDGESRLH